jgi:hypothetical protein
MLSPVDRYVIGRESNILRVDFSRRPNPPAPRFPGASGLRSDTSARERPDIASASLFASSGLVNQKFS